MNTNPPADNLGPRAAQFGGAVLQNCVVCGDPIEERCFCRIPRGGGALMLCCPDCTVQYLDSEQVPEAREQELRAYEESVHLFIGESKPWA